MVIVKIKPRMMDYIGTRARGISLMMKRIQYLGDNLRAISKELLSKSTNDAVDIFGYIDAMKLKSSMTLFHVAGEMCDENRVFYDVLTKYFNGEFDEKTLELIEDY